MRQTETIIDENKIREIRVGTPCWREVKIYRGRNIWGEEATQLESEYQAMLASEAAAKEQSGIVCIVHFDDLEKACKFCDSLPDSNPYCEVWDGHQMVHENT